MRLPALALIALAAWPAMPNVGAAQGASAFDGTWSGTGTLTQRRGRGTACGPETTDRRFTIQNGQISFPYDNRYGVNFQGPIQPNGSFDIASVWERSVVASVRPDLFEQWRDWLKAAGA